MRFNRRKTARAMAVAFAAFLLLDGAVLLEAVEAQGVPGD
jgi:hypothetical protein